MTEHDALVSLMVELHGLTQTVNENAAKLAFRLYVWDEVGGEVGGEPVEAGFVGPDVAVMRRLDGRRLVCHPSEVTPRSTIYPPAWWPKEAA